MLLEDMFANTGRRAWTAFPLAWLQSPGFAVLVSWRLASRLNAGAWPSRILALLIWRFLVANRGCQISLKARIGRRCRFPHAIGIVIGDGARIGEDVTIFQNVTIGRLRCSDKAYPTVGNGAVVYPGSLIAGGITIGEGAVIGASSVVTRDVPAGCTAVGAPARVVVAGTKL